MKHLANVARLGAEDAYGLAVAEGEIDGEMQKFFANEACLEFAAFEFFFPVANTALRSPLRTTGGS